MIFRPLPKVTWRNVDDCCRLPSPTVVLSAAPNPRMEGTVYILMCIGIVPFARVSLLTVRGYWVPVDTVDFAVLSSNRQTYSEWDPLSFF